MMAITTAMIIGGIARMKPITAMRRNSVEWSSATNIGTPPEAAFCPIFQVLVGPSPDRFTVA